MVLFLKKKLDFKVGFIICGTQKGGTTALDFYLRLHNQICMADKKEVHFFDKDELFQRNKLDYSHYHSFFTPNSSHKIIGEATPIYMYWKNVVKRIYSYNPFIKLILVLRNPARRAFSHWNMETQRKRENRTFWKAINEEISNKIVANYLSDDSLKNIDHLILACTHYPLIQNEINRYYKGKVNVIDSSKIVADHISTSLREENLLKETSETNHHFYVSNYTKSFEKSARFFFKEEVNLEEINLHL